MSTSKAIFREEDTESFNPITIKTLLRPIKPLCFKYFSFHFSSLRFCLMIVLYFAIFALAYFLSYQWKFIRLSYSLPHVKGIPFIGLAFKIRKLSRIFPTFDKAIQELGDIFFFWMGPLPIIFVNDAEVAETVFASKHCLDKASFYKPVGKYIGDGLFSLSGCEWQRHRRLLNPSFAHKILLSFFPIFNQGANFIIEDLKKLVDEPASDFSHIFHKTSLNVAAGL